jgi:hypothetical protein
MKNTHLMPLIEDMFKDAEQLASKIALLRKEMAGDDGNMPMAQDRMARFTALLACIVSQTALLCSNTDSNVVPTQSLELGKRNLH